MELKPGVPTKLRSASFDFELMPGHQAVATLAVDRDGNLLEIVLKARGASGKSDEGVPLICANVGIALSRILQRRHPDTGAPIEGEMA